MKCGARGACGAVSVRCFVSRGARGARGAVFRDACGDRTARGARGARGVCGAVFRDTVLLFLISCTKLTYVIFDDDSILGREAEKYCDKRVCLSVCLSVCLGIAMFIFCVWFC